MHSPMPVHTTTSLDSTFSFVQGCCPLPNSQNQPPALIIPLSISFIYFFKFHSLQRQVSPSLPQPWLLGLRPVNTLRVPCVNSTQDPRKQRCAWLHVLGESGSNLLTTLNFLRELTFCTLPRETHSNSAVLSLNVGSLKGIKHFAISKHQSKYFRDCLKKLLGANFDYSPYAERATYM